MRHRLGRRALVAAALAGLVAGVARAQDAPISLGQAVGRLARERSFAESGAGLLKRYAAADPAAVLQGQKLYDAAKASFDELVTWLQTDLDAGTVPTASPELQKALQAAVEQRLAFSRYVDGAVKAEPGAKAGRSTRSPRVPAPSSRACSTARWRSGRSTTRPTSSGSRPSPTDRRPALEAIRGGAGGMRLLLLLLLATIWAAPVRADDGLYTDPFLVLDPGRHTAIDQPARRRPGGPVPGHRLARQDGPGLGGRGRPAAAHLAPAGRPRRRRQGLRCRDLARRRPGRRRRVDGVGRRRRERLPVRPGERAAAAPGRRAAERRQPPRLLARRDPARRDARRQRACA